MVIQYCDNNAGYSFGRKVKGANIVYLVKKIIHASQLRVLEVFLTGLLAVEQLRRFFLLYWLFLFLIFFIYFDSKITMWHPIHISEL